MKKSLTIGDQLIRWTPGGKSTIYPLENLSQPPSSPLRTLLPQPYLRTFPEIPRGASGIVTMY